MSSKMVVCLRGSTPQEVLACFMGQDKLSQVDVIEIRMDYLAPQYYTRGILQKFQEKIPKPLIITCRSDHQGGIHPISQEIRLKLYLTAVNLTYDYVDIEITDLTEFMKLLGNNQSPTKIILSYHNFDQTNLDDIRSQFIKMSSASYDIIKIVTFVRNPQEASDMDIIQNEILSENSMTTIFGMGVNGKSSRISGFLRSNYFSYVSSTFGKKTAAGQLSLSDFGHLLNDFR